MTRQIKKTIAFVGMMGAGKTAVGRTVALKLDVPFLDVDTEIEKAANMSIAEIFSRDGEKFFREREAQVILRLIKGSPTILSTGGGAFIEKKNRQAISRFGVSIWLDVEINLLWSRVKNKDTRPLLKSQDPFETLKTLHHARERTYKLADITVRSSKNYTVDEMAQKVIDKLYLYPNLFEG
jgi:shikimate kinase